MDKMYTICFTGHRPNKLFGYQSEEAYKPLRKRLSALIAEIAEKHDGVHIITGGAQGVDQLAFWAAQHARELTNKPIYNDVFVPFRGQERRWAKYGVFSQAQYAQMLRRADHVTQCEDSCAAQSDNDDYRTVVTKLYRRNELMVDASDMVVAVIVPGFDGKKGGTAACVRYARSCNKPIRFVMAK